jgi:hypothetical protein
MLYHPDNILGGLPPLAFRKLAGCRGEMPIVGIHDDGTVADRPDVRSPFQAHVRIRDQASLFFRRIQPLDQLRGGRPDGANDGRARNHPAVLQSDTVRRCDDDTRFQDHMNAGLLHLRSRKVAQRGTDLGENLLA